MHKFKAPAPVLADTKLTRLERTAFQALAFSESFKFGEIQSTKPTADWYSPNAPSVPCGTADVHSTAHCWSMGDYGLLNDVWQGEVMQHNHRVVIGDKKTKQYLYVAMEGFKDSFVLCWPCSIKPIPKTPLKMVVLVFNVDRPTLQTITDLDSLVCWHYSFRAYSHIWHEQPGCRDSLSPGLYVV